MKPKAVIMILAACLLAPGLRAQSNSPVQYFYDDLGRLVKVVDQSGNLATYIYDVVGNLVSISRSTLPGSNALAILNFTPQQGPAGTTVTIQGQGFSATPSADTVQFNGVAASVTAATTTALTVTVPTGATTGPISVTVSGTQATSASSFTVASLVSITLGPAASSVGPGATQQFRAVGTYSNGTAGDLTTSVSWSSSSASIATISNAAGSQGLATAGSVGGGTTITATLGSISGSTSLQVVALTSISIFPQGTSILPGATQQFNATGNNSNGSTQNLTSSVVWSSANTAVASISNSAGSQGLATAVAVGVTTIQAALGSLNSSVALTVMGLTGVTVSATNQTFPLGQAQQFTATALFNTGFSQTVTSSATWSSSDSTIVTVRNSPGTQGVAVGVKGGQANICASYTAGGFTQSGCASVIVLGALQSITVTPANPSLTQGETLQFVAMGQYAGGGSQAVSAAFTSSNPAVATISNSGGLASAVSVGTTTISASFGSFNASTTLTVVAPVPVSLTVAPAASFVVSGATQQLKVIATLNNGNTQDETTAATWSSPDSTIATVSNTAGSQGLVTGVGAGSATITAALGSLTNTATVIVNSAAPTVFPRFAYLGGQDGTISIYTVDPASGRLRSNGYVMGMSGPSAQITGVALDGSSRFLFTVDSGLTSSALSVYKVNALNGTLTPVQSVSTSTVSTFAFKVAVDPAANYVYIASSQYAASVSGYAFDSTNGALTQVSGSPGDVPYPVSMAVDSLGRFLYAVGYDGAIYAFTIDPATGALNRVNGSPFQPPTGWAYESVTVDPSNQFLLLNQTSPYVYPTGVAVYTIDPSSGALAPVTGSPFAIEAMLLACAPTSPLVYTFNWQGDYATSSTITAYTLNSNGVLTPAGAPYDVGFLSGYMRIDPSGRFMYLFGDAIYTGLFGGSIYGLSPGSGALVPLGSFTSHGTTSYSNVFVVSQGTSGVQYLPEDAYVADGGNTNGVTGSNNILGFNTDPVAGGLNSLGSSPFAEGYSPVFAASDVLGQFLYLANNCSDTNCMAPTGSVSAYTISPSTGNLSPAPGSPFLLSAKAVAVAVDPSERFVYAADASDTSISGYALNSATGSLAPMAGSPFSFAGLPGWNMSNVTGEVTTSLTIDPIGVYLFQAIGCAQINCQPGIAMYKIDPSTGALTLWQTTQFDLYGSGGPYPSAMVVEPTGHYLYMADASAGAVSGSSILPNLFASALPSVPVGDQPSAIAVDPMGRFLYVANAGSGNISAFTIDPAGSGALTPIPGSPFATGAIPVSLSVDFSGKFLYVVCQGDNTVWAYSIDQQLGMLTPTAGSPYPVGQLPVSITTTGKTQ